MATLIKNAWYVAGFGSEIDQKLRRFEILGEPVLLFRRQDGSVAALHDRCPHRLLPLSKGQRMGDQVQCGYHGLTFDSDGKCTRIPGQDKIPASTYVTAYPVVERHDIVWIWMGDAERADPAKIFDLPQFTDPKWHAHQGGALHIKSNYLNVAENLVDPAHVSFVHPTTLGNKASENIPVHVSTEGEVIVAWRWIRDAEPIGFFKAFGGFEGNVDRWHYYNLHMPSIAVIDFGSAAVDMQIGESEDERNKATRVLAVHLMTPVDENHTIDRWMHLRNTAMADDVVSAKVDDLLQTAFAEDLDILEAVHAEEQRPSLRRPIRIAIDRGPMVYRKRINEMIEQERTQDMSAEPSPAFVYHD